MGIVKALAPEVYSKIAAGEVVERPLSVVKELVENSLDAGARNVQIELDEGGKRRIRIRDDGSGFLPEDIEPAFSRHSTSKLEALEDFDRLETLGFRGEALPSIAQVSRITLLSAAGQEGLGLMVIRDGQGEISREEVLCPKGTDLTVSDLFYNFPVRRRFLKSERTELNAILRYIEQLALAYWNIGFSLAHNGRELFAFSAVQSVKERIYQVFGKEFLDGLMPVDSFRGERSHLRGWVSRPGKGGHNKQRQFFFVNGRNVREKTLLAAFNQAYAGALEKERSAQGILLLELPGKEIDVNIHPMKLEIKFADNQAVFSWIYRTLSAALKDRDTPPLFAPAGGAGESEEMAGGKTLSLSGPEMESPFAVDIFANDDSRSEPGLHFSESSDYRLIGQYLSSYIIVEREGKLLLVDQHNAHETVIFHRLRKQIDEKGKVASASSLFPVLCELSPREWAQYEEKRVALLKLGFEIEPLGERTLSIRSYPAELGDNQARETLLDLLSQDTETADPIYPKRLATIACKSAIKVNHPLHELEMKRLLQDFFSLDQREFCPHGRPIVVTFDAEEIEKRLKRR